LRVGARAGAARLANHQIPLEIRCKKNFNLRIFRFRALRGCARESLRPTALTLRQLFEARRA
jgi:hypothetical protein